jgi:hypothetical protein
MALTIDELIARIDASFVELAELPREAVLAKASDIHGQLLRRIFNEGLATDGRPIGQYKDGSWKKRREAEGRQTGYVDLQFSGELFQSIDLGVDGNQLLIGFKNDRNRIAGYLEENYGRAIFTVSESEIQEASQVMADYISARLNEIISTWH